jgi:SNF2 family DNA or RNA helicase
MLDIIELYLRMKGLPYEMLTGSVKTADRISAIQRFNDDKTFGVFLLTTRAVFDHISEIIILYREDLELI